MDHIKTEYHRLLSDAEFMQLFSECKLDPVHFTHEAHLRLAWIHVNSYGIVQAQQNIINQIRAFVSFVGAEDKFNMTLTIAATKAVYHFILKSESTRFVDFISEFPRLKYNFKELMACHYTLDIFNLPKAKVQYLEPDLVPFD